MALEGYPFRVEEMSPRGGSQLYSFWQAKCSRDAAIISSSVLLIGSPYIDQPHNPNNPFISKG